MSSKLCSIYFRIYIKCSVQYVYICLHFALYLCKKRVVENVLTFELISNIEIFSMLIM